MSSIKFPFQDRNTFLKVEFWLALNLIAVGLWLSFSVTILFDDTPGFKIFVILINNIIDKLYDEVVVGMIFSISGIIMLITVLVYRNLIVKIIIYGWVFNLYLLIFISSIYPDITLSFNTATYLVLSLASIYTLLGVGK